MRVLITAGPTREYLDDVRYLSNASSGRMGYAIAEAALAAGHEVVLVTGPVVISPPSGCEVHSIETTDDLLNTCVDLFPKCDGVIAVAAVCDYRPVERVAGKITKTGTAVTFEFIETADVLAELGKQKADRWIIGFALESQDPRANAMRKLKMKNCDCIVLNDTSAIAADSNDVEVLSPDAETVAQFRGTKLDVARDLFGWIEAHIAGE
ncbi:MAG: phosphopantothenoylcysteine decarboxylase [Planctomycetaceae bacterium]|nr:phosphopantothenoylcysteine decarboxylase [Planctomycetaceae bacterium]